MRRLQQHALVSFAALLTLALLLLGVGRAAHRYFNNDFTSGLSSEIYYSVFGSNFFIRARSPMDTFRIENEFKISAVNADDARKRFVIFSPGWDIIETRKLCNGSRRYRRNGDRDRFCDGLPPPRPMDYFYKL